MIVVGSPWIDITLAGGRLAGAVPRLSTICKMNILNQCQMRLSTILAPFDIATTFSMQILVLSYEIGNGLIIDVGPHVVVSTSVQFHSDVRTHDVVKIGGQALHGHGSDYAAVSHAAPAIIA